MKVKVASDELFQQVKHDIEEVLMHYLNVAATQPVLSDIHHKLMDYIRDIDPSDFKLYVTIAEVTKTESGQLEITFSPTDAFVVKIIKEYYETRP